MPPLICITCPLGCRLQAELVGGALTVTGNACPKGEAFALAELTNPMRTLCSTVRARGGMLPVRTDREIPKGAIPAVMALLRGVAAEGPVACGAVVANLAPICEGNIIATCDWI